MRYFIFALAIMLLSGVPSAAQQPKDLKDELGNFKVSMPGTPRKIAQQMDTDNGKVEIVGYVSVLSNNSLVYSVAFEKHPESALKNVDLEQVLNNLRDGAIKPVNGTVTEESAIKLHDFPGRDFTYAGLANGQAINGHGRAFVVGSRLYLLNVVAVGDVSLPDADIKRYFASFELLQR